MSEERPEYGPAASPAATPDDAQPTTATIEGLRRDVEENWNKYLRTAAELDNVRKRSAREVDAARKFGAERLALAILPVRDSIEAGLAAVENADQGTILEGQRATLRLLDEAMAAAGIREISPHGEPFDPTRHEALSLLPSADVEPNTVLEVVQKGYEINDRLLRAAKVIVARPQSGV
ncbi:MAG TPA: nucleotide exchange factor GrpE [Gammaproteobacteria bacterium]|nr:nucleotide exchange factor GrpE [Gammaproteobacteria bacterium]